MQPAPAATRSPRPFLTAQWRWLAMFNYPVDPALLEPLVPRGTQLDLFAGQAYISMVGFVFLDTRLLGFPPPFHRNFEEVNLRFYVRRTVDGEVRRGVTFVKEIVPRRAIALVARWAYNENYVALAMRHQAPPTYVRDASVGGAEYRWRSGGRWHTMQIEVEGRRRPLDDGSHEQFIAEHYWGYCRQRDGGTVEYRVEHPSWQIWPARTARLDCDAASLYGAEFAAPLAADPTSAFLADGSPVAVFRPRRI